MSYQVLARKWRPNAFADVVGQDHVLKIISNALSLGRVHHAYLFSGTRGVGKTSIARLLAKGLNCETGVTSSPCGQCDNCLDIEQGRFVDLIEIDAASRTKVEDTREILDNVQYLPSRGRFKVYLIDEVHMLSRSSFNALLKTLEEPPEHVKFLLATTDPQKLPITILSRCLHLHLKILDNTEIEQQLSKILHAEAIPEEKRALQLLAKAANGSMRDALSLTDQAIALGNGKVDATSVAAMLGTLDDNIAFSLIESLLNGDGGKLMQHIQNAGQQGADWDALLSSTINLLHQIAVLQFVPSALGDYQHHEQRIRHLAHALTPADVQLYYEILLEGRKSLAITPDKKVGVEMALLRAIAFQPKVFIEYQEKQTQVAATTFVENNMPVSAASSNTTKTAAASIVNNPIVNSKTTTGSQPIVSDPIAKPTTNAVIEQHSDSLSALTKNILRAREKLTQSEITQKKSKTAVEQSQTITNSIINNFGRDSEEDEDVIETAETYQWQAKMIAEASDKSQLVSSKNFKKALEHDKTPELTQKLIAEVIKQDAWAAQIEKMALPPLLKQLALQSTFELINENSGILHLRSSIQHLNTKTNHTELQKMLSEYYQQLFDLDIVIDDDPTIKTPLELREIIYQQKLIDAKKIIHNDKNIGILTQYFDAQIDEESIRPI